MDKQTLSNYGWIVIAVLVLCVMIAMATPFGNFIKDGVVSARDGLFDVNQNALDVVLSDGLPKDTDTMIYRLSSLDPNITYTDFTITNSNRAKIGYTDTTTDLVIPVAFKDGDTWYKVTSIGSSAFRDCTKLTSVVIGDSVTKIGNSAFYGCDSLTSITVDENNPNYCSIDGVLFSKDKTKLIQYPIGNTRTTYTIPDSVTSIGQYAFYTCSKLTSVEIPDSVTSIDYYAFRDCTSLTSIEIPDSVTSIGGSAFYGCYNLTSIEIPDSVTKIGNSAFGFCKSLTSITADENNPNYCSVDGVLFSKDKTTLIQYPIGNTRTTYTIPDSVTSIGEWTFVYCDSLTSITFENPNGWWYADSADATSGTSIDVTDPATNAQNLSKNYSTYNKYLRRS